MQPVLIQKLKDKFELPSGRTLSTPALIGWVLVKETGNSALDPWHTTKYHSGTAICKL